MKQPSLVEENGKNVRFPKKKRSQDWLQKRKSAQVDSRNDKRWKLELPFTFLCYRVVIVINNHILHYLELGSSFG